VLFDLLLALLRFGAELCDDVRMGGGDVRGLVGILGEIE
jgi:hypothetical protein